MQPIPVEPRRDDTAADAATLEEMGVIDPQPVADPNPPDPPVYDPLADAS